MQLQLAPRRCGDRLGNAAGVDRDEVRAIARAIAGAAIARGRLTGRFGR